MKIRAEIRSLDKVLRKVSSSFTGRQLNTAISRGINRSLMEGRTEARKAVKDVYNIPQKNLDGIDFKKATTQKLTGLLFASTKPIPMDAFSPKFETPTASIRVTKKGQQKIRDRKRTKTNPTQGVSIEVHKGKREVVPFAFMARNTKPRVFARGQYRSGSFGFQRRFKREKSTGTDTPIKPMISVTVYAAVINPVAIRKVKDRVENAFPKHVSHEIKRVASSRIK